MERSEIDAVRRETRERFGRFIAEKLNPSYRERRRTRAPIPKDLYREAGDLGILGYAVPTQDGGAGHAWWEWCLVSEELCYLCEETVTPSIFSTASTFLEADLPSETRQAVQPFVSDWVRGAHHPAFAFTDTGDVYDFKTTARRRSDEWVLSGFKPIIIYGIASDSFVVYARAEESPDLMAFLIDADAPGVTVSPVEAMGFETAGLASLAMRDVRVPDERLVISSNGLATAFAFLMKRRLLLACEVVGTMRRMLEMGIEVLTTKIRYKQRVADFQTVQAEIGKLYMGLETTRSTIYRALSDQREGNVVPLFDLLGTIAKYGAVERASELASTLVRILGTESFLVEQGFDRFLRDVPAFVISATAQPRLEIDMGEYAVAQWEARGRLD